MNSAIRSSFVTATLGTALLCSASFAQFNDTLWHDLFGATGPKNAAGLDSFWLARSTHWSVRYPNTDTAEIYATGSTSNNTYLIYKQLLSDFEFEVKERLPGASTNSGVQIRSTCYTTTDQIPCGSGYRVCGPQADLGHTHNGELFAECGNALVNVNTTNGPNTAPNYIVNNTNACRQTQKQYPLWNIIRARVVGDRVVGYMNDVKCYEYTITNSSWLGSGIFALQYHTGGATVSFQYIKLKLLTTPVAIAPSGARSAGFYALAEGPERSLLLDVRGAGAYSVQIADLDGTTRRTFQGRGPVSGQRLSLGTSGVFAVHVTAGNETASRLVHVK